jgi:hypothetical protein
VILARLSRAGYIQAYSKRAAQSSQRSVDFQSRDPLRSD